MMNLKNRIAALVLVACAVSSPAHCPAGDWAQFLGPHRNGMSSETGLVETFPKTGPKIEWRTELGVGMSGLAVSRGKLVTLFQDERQYAVALDAATGKELWKTPLGPAYENAMGNGPRATPTIHDGSVYVFTGEGNLAALALDSGLLKWSIDTPAELFSKPAEYGMASSPLVVGELVVVQVGSHRGTVAAFERETGKQKWAVGTCQAGYSSPILATLAGRSQIVAFAGDRVLGINPDDGAELWHFLYETDYNCNTASPVVLDDSTVLISSGENHGSAALRIAADGDKFSVMEAWTSFGKDSVLRAEWQTPILLDGHLYGMDNIGSAGTITNLVCVDAATGKQLWMEPRFGKSNLICADSKLFISTMRGELIVVKATTEGFQETGRTVVTGMTRQAPALAEGLLYMRDDREVVCVNVQAKAE
ncbi:MAG: PQQ-binding-like beta-propeller repeat protein [Planctomycetaceae bacterium]